MGLFSRPDTKPDPNRETHAFSSIPLITREDGRVDAAKEAPGYADPASGATSRTKAPDYSLSPKELNDAAVARFQYGVDKGHERDNWRRGKDSPTYQWERMNHAKKHFDKILDGTGHWSDVQALICNLAMLCWWRVNGDGFAKAFPHLVELEVKSTSKNV